MGFGFLAEIVGVMEVIEVSSSEIDEVSCVLNCEVSGKGIRHQG